MLASLVWSSNISVAILKNIQINTPHKQIMSRLGYRATTSLSDGERAKIDKVIKSGVSNCELRLAYILKKIVNISDDKIVLEDDITWQSKSLSQFLSGCKEIFLICVTAGSKIVELRDSLIEEDNLFASVIIDAVGSEMAEGLAKWSHEFLGNIILKEGKKLTKRRYSPGYGDFALDNQKSIYNLLELDKIGVELSQNSILIPEKSVTAIIGVEV